MRNFLQLSPNNTMKDVVTITNLNAISSQFEDGLDADKLSTGIIWTGNELVEGTNPEFQTNVPIPTTSMDAVHIQNVKIYFASLNKLINIDDIYLDLSDFSSPYLSYLVLYDDLSYDFVVQKPEDYQSNRCVIARLFKPTEQILQFYFCPPHIDATHYELSYPWYEFCDGGEPDLYTNKTIGFGPAELKFPSLNFSHPENRNVVIFTEQNPASVRYSAAGNSVDYDHLYLTIDTDHYLRNNETVNTVPDDKYTLSRFYLDPYENVIIQQFGTEYYETLFDAMTEYQTYHQPDPNNKYDYVPLGALIYKKGISNLTDKENVRWYTDHDKSKTSDKDNLYAIDIVCREILALFQQQVDERFTALETRCTLLEQRCTLLETRCTDLEARMGQAETEITNIWTSLRNHLSDYNNPHRVTKVQVGLGNVDNFATATQVEAQTGTANDKFMTPLRTKQGVQYYGVTKLNPSATEIAIQVEGSQPSVQAGKTILWFTKI